jgi:hypothetical protein
MLLRGHWQFITERRQRVEERPFASSRRRHDEDEPPQHHLVGLAEHSAKILGGPEIGFDGATFALHSGLLDLQIGEGLRLDRNPRRCRLVAALERRSVLSAPALLMKRFAFFVREILISPTNPSSRYRALSHLVVDVREVMRLAKKVSYGAQ